MVANRIKRFVWGISALIGLTAVAASAAVPARIAAVDDATRARLTGAISPRLQQATDLGAAPSTQLLSSMSLRFSMTAAQQTALTTLLANQQNPSSPSYHQWLTPEQFAARFGMASTDIAQVTAWLKSQGFTVTEIARGGQFIRFSGTVAQAQQAFQTQIDRVTLNGVQHIANTIAPSLPASIAAVTATITGLNDFSLHPRHFEAATPSADPLHPQFTSAAGTHYVAPGDLYTIYDENGLLTSSTNGAGVTLAVMGQSDVNAADLAAFRSAAGLPANPPTTQLYGADPGGSSAADLIESELDLEWAGAAAPSASILFVTSTEVLDGSLTEAIDNNVAPVITMTYGACEADYGVSQLAYYTQLLQQGAAEGITLIGAGGDDGASDCDYNAGTASGGLAVDFPGSSPYVTSVGGTALNEGTGTYWSSTNGAYAGSATSYIPETVWNDDSYGALAAGGGGASAYFPKPSWQTGTGVPNDASRDVPDVALSASPHHDPYLVCIPGYCTNGFYGPSNVPFGGGGTSFTSPIFAGFMALVVQKQGRVGVANNTLYALANSTYAANVFHDITTGNNDSPCVTGTTNCPTGVAFGYSAAVGYDLASGWGSVDVGNLVNDWPLVAPLTTTPAGTATSLTNLAGSASSATAGASITLTATVAAASTNASTTPTGTVQFTYANATGAVTFLGSATLTSGVATYTLNTTTLATGNYTVQATYPGDATYLGSKGAFKIAIVTATSPAFTLTPATTTVTVASGSVAQGVLYTVTPVNGFNGTVTFTASATTNVAADAAFSANPITISNGVSGTTTLTLLAFELSAVKSHSIALAANARPTVPPQRNWQRIASGVVFAGIFVLLFPRRRKLSALLLAILAVGALSLSGCTSNTPSSINPPQVNTPAGTYNLTISATSTVNGTAVTQNAALTFIVQ